MGAFEDYISGSWQGLQRGGNALLDSWKPGLVDGIKSYDGAITGTDLPYYGDDEISAAREYFDRQPRSNSSRLVDLIGNYMPGMAASKAAPVAVRAGETVLGAGPAFKQRVAETALDMAPEARAQRAAEQGFTEDAYRATTRAPDQVDPVSFFAKDADYAEEYAKSLGGNAYTIPAKIKPGRQLTVDLPSREFSLPDFEAPHIQRAMSEGYDTVRFRDLGAQNGGYGMDDFLVAVNPANVRSRFAAFDPAKANSSDLLAAHANPLSQLQQMYRDREER